MLRQPLENEKVTISRVHSTVTYPEKFIFIAVMNPCPCGYSGSNTQYCTCAEKQIKAYNNRVSGPILDRIDILLSLELEKVGTNQVLVKWLLPAFVSQMRVCAKGKWNFLFRQCLA